MKINNKKFIYLISPDRKLNSKFIKELIIIFKTGRIGFFQLRLKKYFLQRKIIAKKIQKLCKSYRVKFIINDDPYFAKKINADGCHLGQNDVEIREARKILKNKIIGITCHNSIKLAKDAILKKADYIAFGAFYSSKTKKVKYRANLNTLKKFKNISNIPIVAIGGITSKNYKKLLLNNANFLAISGYIWNNKKFKPSKAVKNLL